MANKVVHVAAAAIRDEQGQLLIAKRPDDKHQGGLWEFPGGKVESGEPVLDALDRELHEELGINISQARPLIRVPYHYPDKSVLLDVYEVSSFTGTPWGKEGQPVKWIRPVELDDYAFPAANQPILNACLLPSTIAITPAGGMEHVLAFADAAVAKGAKALLLRAHGLDDPTYCLFARELLDFCHNNNVMFIANCSLELGKSAGFEAVHLTSERLDELGDREEFNGRWLSASCHSLEELQQAESKGLDFAFLSPVLETSSHPDMSGIGWEQYACFVDQVTLPVYALGGVSGKDCECAFKHGGQGVAAISAWLQD